MNIDLFNISADVNEKILWEQLAHVLHSPPYTPHRSSPIRFIVRILRTDGQGRKIGEMTVPTEAIGEHFLAEFECKLSRRRLIIFGEIVVFKRGTGRSREKRAPQCQSKDAPMIPISRIMLSNSVAVEALQFGHYCRDDHFSVEWERSDELRTILAYDKNRAMFQLVFCEKLGTTRYVAFRSASIGWVGAGPDVGYVSVISFGLNYAPPYLMGSWRTPRRVKGDNEGEVTKRVSAFDDNHAPLVPYTSSAIRILCKSPQDVDRFRKLADLAHLHVDGALYPTVRRDLFAPSVRESYEAWIGSIPWPVAFQVEAMVRASRVDLTEVHRELRARIVRMNKHHGPELTSAFLYEFRTQLLVLDDSEDCTLLRNWTSVLRDFLQRPRTLGLPMTDNEDLFSCFHVVVTPTTLLLSGPFPEQSNRVIRQYKAHQDCFIRVSFLDETKLAYRHDRYVDTSSLILERVRRFLVDGLAIAGRPFSFLAYSQSGLKEHAVWFVKPFRHAGRLVTAETIIQGLGSFRDLPYDRELMRCPARYAARLSQAFTATDSALSMQPEDMLVIPDIITEDREYCFTDGVGTLSPKLARAIWDRLQAKGRRRSGRVTSYPRLFQIRLGGSKGMLSVDYKMKGHIVALRPSMIKYDAPRSLSVEIVRAFDRPSRYLLNRMQIMLLEHRGVPYEVFKTLQDNVVRDVHRATDSLDMAAHTLEAYGLGASCRLSSTMRSLHRLGVGSFTEDVSWQRMMNFAINHVLRDLKHHARIPVTNGWTLVGVADNHKYLGENEIFACVDDPDKEDVIYLKGPIMVTRSPSIHPGDIQIVHAIGKPPPGSPLSREVLKNGVVFSTIGLRPISTQLGGGDLDGDVYNLTPMVELHPTVPCEPAAYKPAERKVLDRESTMVDVADFVTDYITSDTLGVIATNWLLIADESGIFDEECLQLSQLHSTAVDYPKTGKAVPLVKIPKFNKNEKKLPDWYAPETRADNDDRYRTSQSAVGKLFRAIKLPSLETANASSPRQIEDMQLGAPNVFLQEYRQWSYGRHDILARLKVESHVQKFICVSYSTSAKPLVQWMGDLLASFACQLRSICALNTITEYSGLATLTEEEALVGTIADKTSQPRRRTDAMARLRDQSEMLVKAVRTEISGVNGTPHRQSLQQAWVAYNIGLMKIRYFGGKSFAWIALGEIFDVIKAIEEEERALLRQANA